ncbi:vitamin B12-transporter ATPase [Vibrio ichthyoenteri ATCC 700023]|uniref:Vitamin B12 import ATP-binding protein BtuD n=1 Tax=Vibrio ichthyoenteri ATCC 700023 TaxID=870968 RepID=F9S4S6_9VIBR|nr:vitamin B12 ABC transporter ATP-binding protein BtuD [Vibrio ichthyoenteri]EGU36475.1 vitamin B12-transporter ATPase [Vibrio ichthyoenteri ATCC 700023]
MILVNSLSVGSRLLPLSFEAQAGDIVHVIGPNGSGKSTLLAAVSGLLESNGETQIADLTINQASISQLADYRAFLSQSDRPAFNLEVAHYLSLSIPAHAKFKVSEIEQAVIELAGILQLQDKLHRSIHQLSGGEWQRVRLCAICLQIWPSLNPFAKVLILDEPAAPLDIGQEALLYQLIDRVAAMGLTVLMSNHDLNRTLKHADKALLLEKGVMKAFGEVSEVLEPERLSSVFNTRVERIELKDKSILLFD